MVLAFWKRRNDTVPYTIYQNVAEASRQAGLYERIGVPDTISGRFDMLMAHAILALRRLNKVEGDRRQEAAARAQTFSDVLFKDLDRALRETGVSDRKVPKRLKLLAQAFLGRGKAYGEALDAGDRDQLAEVVMRNLGGIVFHADRSDVLTAAAARGETIETEALEQSELEHYAQVDGGILAAYLQAADVALAQQDDTTVCEGSFAWPDVDILVKGYLEETGSPQKEATP
ncbi:MAG: ubiquinol-cytochrome C chaperone family protein [Pseudomonadota bacterium]